MVKMNWRQPYSRPGLQPARSRRRRLSDAVPRDVLWMAMTDGSARRRSPSAPNAWLVDEMYEQYRQDPASVSESWREFFADYHHGGANLARPSTPTAVGRCQSPGPAPGGGRRAPDTRERPPTAGPPAPAARRRPAADEHRGPHAPAAAGRPPPSPGAVGADCRHAAPGALRCGAAARIVANMRPVSRCRPRPAFGWCRPGCSRSTAGSSTTSSAESAAPARSASPT